MKTLFAFITAFALASCLTIPALAGVDPSNQLKLGDGAASDKSVVFNKGSGASNPRLKFSNSASEIQVCNNGTTCKSINKGTDISSGAATLGQILQADGSGGTSWASQSGAPDQSYEVSNHSLAVTAGTTMAIYLKGRDGNDPSPSNQVKLGFRNATASTGTYAQSVVTAGMSITLAATDSIGQAANAGSPFYVYMIKDTSNELCASYTRFDEGSLQTGTALTGGADTDATKLWCTSAHTSKPIRLIGRITSVWSNPNWASPTEISLVPFENYKMSTHAAVVACSASPSVTRIFGTWLTGATSRIATGRCAYTIASGVYSRPPVCVVTNGSPTQDPRVCYARDASTTTTNFEIFCFTTTSGAAVDTDGIQVICNEPQ